MHNIQRRIVKRQILGATTSLMVMSLTEPLFAQPQHPLSSMLAVIFQPSGDDSEYLEVAVRNTSGKSITAYTIDLAVLSPNGSSNVYKATLDLLPSYASATRSPVIVDKYQHFGALRDGDQLFRHIGVKNISGNQITATVTTIVFDDNTIAGDREWAQFVFDHHAGASAELSTLIRGLGNQPASNLRSQIGTWRRTLPQQWQAARNKPTALTKGGASGVAFARTFVLSKLAEISRDSLSDADVAIQFKSALSYFSDTADDMRQHSILAEVNK